MSKINVAFLGTGLLGAPMAQKLLEAGYPLTVYNRTRHKTEALAKAGARVADTPALAVSGADRVIVMLADYGAICAVLFGAEEIPLAGKTLIQMGTVSPQQSLEIADRVAKKGGRYLEAPVLGSIPQAKSASLMVFAGGTQEDFVNCKSLLETFGSRVHRVGPVGQAAAFKLGFNQLIASLTTAFSMTLGYLRRKDIDITLFMDVLRESALYAPTFDKKLSRMMDRDFANPNFPVKHLLKDVNLVLGEFKGEKIHGAALEGVAEALKEALGMGFGDCDYSALYNAVHPEGDGVKAGL